MFEDELSEGVWCRPGAQDDDPAAGGPGGGLGPNMELSQVIELIDWSGAGGEGGAWEEGGEGGDGAYGWCFRSSGSGEWEATRNR